MPKIDDSPAAPSSRNMANMYGVMDFMGAANMPPIPTTLERPFLHAISMHRPVGAKPARGHRLAAQVPSRPDLFAFRARVGASHCSTVAEFLELLKY